MKKVLSLVLSIVMVLSLCTAPAFALTDDEITNATGTHNEVIAMVDMGSGLSGSSPAGTYTAMVVSQGTNVAYVDKDTDPDNPVTYPILAYEAETITQDDLAKTHPHLVNNSINKNIFKWSQNMGGAMFRIRGMAPHDSIKKGDLVKITAEICVTDVRPYVDPTGKEVPIDNTCIDSYKMNFLTVYSTSKENYSSTKDGNGGTVTLPIDKWVTFSLYVTPENDDITGIRIENSLGGAGNVSTVTKPCPNTILIGRMSYEKVKPNNQPIEDPISYTEDFEKHSIDTTKYDASGAKATEATEVKYSGLTDMSTADKYIYMEDGLTYKDSANPNDKTKYATGSTTVDSNYTYKYTYPTSGTSQGKYQLYGDATLGDTGVKDASFGFGYAGEKYITSADGHLSAADRLASSNAKRSVITLPDAVSGKNMLVASGLYNKNASVRFNNIYGSHPVARDIGKKFKVSFFAYPDSTMGAYEADTEAYATAKPIAVDTSTPVSITVSNNGPVGNIYTYNSTYTESSVGTFEVPWDRWSKLEFLCEITTESIDNHVIDNLKNTLRNSLQISQFNAEEQIADTIYFDDLSIEQVEAGTQATFSAYSFDGTYDISAKITSTTIAGDATVHLVVAEYDKISNRLVAVYTSRPITFNFSTLPVAPSLSNIKPIDVENTMRAYLIDTYTGLCPYISPANVASILETIE